LPAQAVPVVGVGEGLAEVGGGCLIPQVHTTGGGGRGDRLVLGAARPGVGAAAEPGEQGEGVAAVAEPAPSDDAHDAVWMPRFGPDSV